MIYSKISCFLLLVYLLFRNKEVVAQGQPAGPQNRPQQQQQTSTTERIPIKFHENHRLIQWCVNGVDEPEFQKYPWSEFAPILQRRYDEHYSANVRFKYTVDLHPIELKLDTTRQGLLPNVGSGPNLIQRAHFVFKAFKRREFRYNVKASYNDTIIEGLLVQMNFAPQGVGMPANAQFVNPKDFNCVDCEKPIGIPIACRRRTYIHSIHPTILAFHHRMQVPKEEAKRRKKYCIDSKLQDIKQCILTGFQPNPDPVPPANPGLTLPALNLGQPTLHYNWYDLLRLYIGHPHPRIRNVCRMDEECEGIFKEWFAGAPNDPAQGVNTENSGCCHHPGAVYCNEHIEVAQGAPEQEFQYCECQEGQTPHTHPNPNNLNPAPEPVCDCLPTPPLCPTEIDQQYQIYKDPKRQSLNWPTWECRPATVKICRPPGFAATESTPWETVASMQEDYTGAQTPQPVTGLPFNRDHECCLDTDTDCPANHITCPTAAPQKTVCTVRAHLPYNRRINAENDPPDTTQCEDIDEKKYYDRSSEIHGNLVWYSPPCDLSPKNKRVRFQMLIVHSFSKGVYSIVESDDYYDLVTGSPSNDGNPFIPSPLFSGFNHFCEKPTQSVSFLYSKTYQRTPFDYSRSYDECVQKIGDNVNHQMCNSTPHFVPFRAATRRNTGAAVLTARVPKCDVSQVFTDPPPCEDTCPQLESTTQYEETSTSWNPVKRTLHGGINIITNFCIMPICIFIARFYKETYNLQGFKGQRTWFWMHMIGSGGSTVLMYMGYFTSKLVDLTDRHVIYGNIYIIFLGLSYCTSWMRHKKRLISSIMEICHSIGGYGCLILALFCVTNASKNGEPLNEAVKLIVYVAIASLTVFYLGMTIHICSLDRRFGMKPRRWHFPIVESRFDDLPVPGRRVRQFFLFALLFVNLPLTISTLFL